MKVKIITTTDYSEKELEEQVNYWFDFKWRDTWELVDIKYTYQYICNTFPKTRPDSVFF